MKLRAGATGTFPRRIISRPGPIRAPLMERLRFSSLWSSPCITGKSAHEILSILLGKPDQNSHEIVKGYWQTQYKSADFDTFWKTSLHDGWIDGTAISAS